MISVVIPAYNEVEILPQTLSSLEEIPFWDELLVIDDGSTDGTRFLSLPPKGRWLRHEKNLGKGKALETGLKEAKGELLLLLDADLGKSAMYAKQLIFPILQDRADVTIAKWSSKGKDSGFGVVKGVAKWGIYALTRHMLDEPLSGQRCYHRRVLPYLTFKGAGFGIEVSMDIDLLRAEARLAWIDLQFTHRGRGRGIDGFWHRGKQGIHIIKTLIQHANDEK
ncbi:MAG: glycosyltransferase family 2 protein [Thermicanus sp.]|nr:glycosyltransferase family 2 protein [Thermicanus sp.]